MCSLKQGGTSNQGNQMMNNCVTAVVLTLLLPTLAWVVEANGPTPDIPQDILTAAAAGDPEAEFQVGDAHCPEKKVCVEKNKRTAIEWFQKAASKGHVGAELKLGLALLHGHGIKQDLEAGFQYVKKAADKGMAAANFRLGLCYLYGRGVERDVAEAVRCIREAAEDGMVDAQLKMSELYLQGRGVPEDHAEALVWCRKAADQGRPEAQVNIGTCYFEGKGVEQNPEEALRWWRMASELGIAQGNTRVATVAVYNLALAYQQGKGVPEDLAEAGRLYGEAAKLGDFRGRFYQASCYFKIWWRRWRAPKAEAPHEVTLEKEDSEEGVVGEEVSEVEAAPVFELKIVQGEEEKSPESNHVSDEL